MRSSYLTNGTWWRLTAILMLTVTLAGCAVNEFIIVQQGKPRPFDASSTFYLQPVRFSGLRINERFTEEEYRSLNPGRNKALGVYKDAVLDRFENAFLSAAAAPGVNLRVGGAANGPGEFLILPNVTAMTPGDATVDMTLTIMSGSAAGNVVIDEVVIKVESGDGWRPQDHLGGCGERLGRKGGAYLKKRLWTEPGK